MQYLPIIHLNLRLFYQNTQNQFNFLVLYITKFSQILSYDALEMMERYDHRAYPASMHSKWGSNVLQSLSFSSCSYPSLLLLVNNEWLLGILLPRTSIKYIIILSFRKFNDIGSYRIHKLNIAFKYLDVLQYFM